MEVSEIMSIFAGVKNINMEENDVMIAAEPAAALLSEEVRRSGILSQVMKLSQPDKVALIAYLKRGMETEEPFKTDEFGRIKLTQIQIKNKKIKKKTPQKKRCCKENKAGQRGREDPYGG